MMKDKYFEQHCVDVFTMIVAVCLVYRVLNRTNTKFRNWGCAFFFMPPTFCSDNFCSSRVTGDHWVAY